MAEESRPPVRLDETVLTPEYAAVYADVPATLPAGGDFHHAFPVQDGSGDIAVVIGDVAGHGPEQSAQAAHMRELLSDCLLTGLSPAETLTAVNAMIEPDPNFEVFGTVFVGKITPETGVLTYASGGHEPALIADPMIDGEAHVEELNGTGPPVGAFPPDLARFKQEEAHVPDGGTLLLYTDGVSDARHPQNRREWLGVEGLKTILSQFASLSPRNLVSELLNCVVAFCRGQLHDDVAIMAVRRRFSRSSSRKTPPTSKV